MDFTKFVYLLEYSALYFTRGDEFEDPWEGTFPPVVNNMFRRQLGKAGVDDQEIETVLKNIGKLRKLVFINCWHMNQYDSAAMWRLYAKTNEAIAIQTSIRKLIESVNNVKIDIYIGRVEYADYESVIIDSTNLLNAFVLKRKSFEHENELRMIVMTAGDPEQKGINVEVNLNQLIEQVYVAPDSPDWFKILTEKIRLRFGLRAEVIKSQIFERPLY